MRAIDHRASDDAEHHRTRPTRFHCGRPQNGHRALRLSLETGAVLCPPAPGEDAAAAQVRHTVRQLVALSTAANTLAIQRRLLSDVFDDQPGSIALTAVNARVQATAASITHRAVVDLEAISESGVPASAWHDLIVPPADTALARARHDAATEIERLPLLIADNLADALALDRTQRVHAASFLVQAAGGAVALFALAGMS